jgi:hypothetical protein
MAFCVGFFDSAAPQDIFGRSTGNKKAPEGAFLLQRGQSQPMRRLAMRPIMPRPASIIM